VGDATARGRPPGRYALPPCTAGGRCGSTTPRPLQFLPPLPAALPAPHAHLYLPLPDTRAYYRAAQPLPLHRAPVLWAGRKTLRLATSEAGGLPLLLYGWISGLLCLISSLYCLPAILSTIPSWDSFHVAFRPPPPPLLPLWPKQPPASNLPSIALQKQTSISSIATLPTCALASRMYATALHTVCSNHGRTLPHSSRRRQKEDRKDGACSLPTAQCSACTSLPRRRHTYALTTSSSYWHNSYVSPPQRMASPSHTTCQHFLTLYRSLQHIPA